MNLPVLALPTWGVPRLPLLNLITNHVSSESEEEETSSSNCSLSTSDSHGIFLST